MFATCLNSLVLSAWASLQESVDERMAGNILAALTAPLPPTSIDVSGNQPSKLLRKEFSFMRRRTVFLVFLLTPILTYICLLVVPRSTAVAICAQTTRKALPYRFLVPEGYVGWIRVDFDVSNAPLLPVEDGFYIFKFPKSGRLQTSSSDVVDSRWNEFFYYSADEKYRIRVGGPLESRLVQQEFSGPGRGHRAPVPNRYRYIFIGPTDVFESYQASDKHDEAQEIDGYPKVGAKKWLTHDYLVKMRIKKPGCCFDGPRQTRVGRWAWDVALIPAP
jgi:hypothetical protein